MSLPQGITEVIGKLRGVDVKFYNIPFGFDLYKATKIDLARNYAAQQKITLKVGSYFFGLPAPYADGSEEYNNYIESYQDTYGVIYKFKTLHEFQLLAMDDYATVSVLYSLATDDVKQILINNYGYLTGGTQLGRRTSDPDADTILVNYLKTIKLGYAIFNMTTDGGGSFHPELFFYNITPGDIACDGIVTGKTRYERILNKIQEERAAQQTKDARRKRGARFIQDPVGSPGAGGYASPPGAGGYASPLGAGGYDSPLGAGGNASPPGAGGYDSPPRAGGYDSPPARGRGGKRKRTKKTTNRKKRKPKKRTSRKK